MTRRGPVAALAAALLILTQVAGAAAATPAPLAPPMSVARYATALRAVAAHAEQAPASTAAGAAAVSATEALLRPVVHTSAGDLVFVDNRSLLQAMLDAQGAAVGSADRASRWRDLSRRVSDILAWLPRPGTGARSRVAVEQQAVRVLSQPSFSSLPIPPESLLDRVVDWIMRQLRRIHGPSVHAGPAGPGALMMVRVVFWVLLVGAATVIVALLVRRILERRGRRFTRLAPESDLSASQTERELVAAHDHHRLRAMADDAAADGDYRDAFRLVFLATLVYLDAEGAIRLVRSLTNWEYLALLSHRPRLRPAFSRLVRAFDRIWYGGDEASATDFREATAVYDQFRGSATQAPGPKEARV